MSNFGLVSYYYIPSMFRTMKSRLRECNIYYTKFLNKIKECINRKDNTHCDNELLFLYVEELSTSMDQTKYVIENYKNKDGLGNEINNFYKIYDDFNNEICNLIQDLEF